MMKVLFVSSLSASCRTSYNFRLERLAQGLKELGCDTDMLYLGDCRFRRPGLLQLFNLSAILKKSKTAGIIHAGGTGCAYVCAVLKKTLGKPVIYDVHGDTVLENWGARRRPLDLRALGMTLQSMMMERAAQRLQNYIVCSKPLADLLRARGVSPGRIAVIRNGADTDLFTPGAVTSGAVTSNAETGKKDRFIFGYAGGGHYYQGLNILLKAAAYIKESGVEIRVAGVAKSGPCPDNVKYYGKLEHQDIPDFIKSCDVLVIPRPCLRALYYSGPTKFAEYLAAGKPVLATDVSEISAFIQKAECGIVTKADPEDLTGGMRKFFSLPQEELVRMGQNARKLALEVFDLRKISQEYLGFLKRFYDGSSV